MSIESFHKLPAGTIETLFNEQKQPLFKWADSGKYLGIEKIKYNFKDFSLHYACARSEIEGACLTGFLGRAKNSHDVFINLDGSIEMAVRSKNPKAVALEKCLSKKGVEKIQEEHRRAITDHGNQIQALEEHQQEILRLNKEIHDLISNRHATRRGYFNNMLCFIKRTAKRPTHTTLSMSA